MCSACVTMRPRSSKSAVEQSRRSLMFAENAERTSAAPISSAIARSEAPITWSSTSITRALLRTRVPCSSVAPSQPDGHPDRRSVELEHLRPARAHGLAGHRDRRGRAHLGGPHGDELERPLRVGVAVARLVCLVEALGEARAERNRRARRTGPRSAGPLRPRAEARPPPRAARRTCARRPVARRPRRGREPRAPRRRPGTSTVSIPSSSASAQACSGPAPPNATSAKSRGSRPCSTETTRRARTISAFDDVDDRRGIDSPSARSAASRSSSIPPGSAAGRRPRSRLASLTVGLVPPRP